MKKDPKIQRSKARKLLMEMRVPSLAAVILSALILFYTKSPFNAVISFISILAIYKGYIIGTERLKESSRVKKMESVFPDFIELMASNLRAGMTIDQALLLSSRKEFSPLDEEILKLGKDVVTGKDLDLALIALSKRIKSEKIQKTINVINSGIRSGGNLAVLLEETAVNMRERSFVEKRAASNVLMYVIFIFFAAGIGAPTLFSLSSVLVQVLSQIVSGLPAGQTATAVPFALTKISVSSGFITGFSLTFTIAVDFLASMLLGLINKGEEKEGLKYLLPLATLSIIIYFTIRFVLMNYFGNLIG